MEKESVVRVVRRADTGLPKGPGRASSRLSSTRGHSGLKPELSECLLSADQGDASSVGSHGEKSDHQRYLERAASKRSDLDGGRRDRRSSEASREASRSSLLGSGLRRLSSGLVASSLPLIIPDLESGPYEVSLEPITTARGRVSFYTSTCAKKSVMAAFFGALLGALLLGLSTYISQNFRAKEEKEELRFLEKPWNAAAVGSVIGLVACVGVYWGVRGCWRRCGAGASQVTELNPNHELSVNNGSRGSVDGPKGEPGVRMSSFVARDFSLRWGAQRSPSGAAAAAAGAAAL